MKTKKRYLKTSELLRKSLDESNFATVKKLSEGIYKDADCHYSGLHSIETSLSHYFCGMNKPSKKMRPFLVKYLGINLSLLIRTIQEDEKVDSYISKKDSMGNLIKKLSTLLVDGMIQNIPRDKLISLIDAETSLSYHCSKMSLSEEQILLLLQKEKG